MSNKYALSLIDFLNESHCNFMAVNAITRRLDAAGYKRISPADAWDFNEIKKFYITKNDSAVFAVSIGTEPFNNGFRIIAAHSDSPGFRIKPKAEMISDGGIVKLNTEVYGGPILYTWFDRPLSMAGRVMLRGEDALHPVSRIIDIKRPIMVIPHLAIHFNRNVNDGNKLSKQKDMLPMLGIINSQAEKGNMLINLLAKELDVKAEEIIDFDMLLYPVEKASLVGINEEFVCGGRIDDLSMAHAGLTALLESNNDKCTKILAIFDNEETGSGTKQGAASPILLNTLERCVAANGGNNEEFMRAIANTFMISADNGHAFHPNYPEKYDPTNHPVMGGGPIIKINANCKYMTDAHSAAIFSELCRKAGVPCQTFVNHSDVAGGSTLGNILTAQLDIAGVDVGNPIWAMHSACETGAAVDQEYMIRTMTAFFNE